LPYLFLGPDQTTKGTLAEVIPAIEQLISNTSERFHADAGYRGHNAPPDYKFKLPQSRNARATPQIKREMKRRSAVEPVIGHLKDEHRMSRNYLAHRHGDFNDALLAAVGYNAAASSSGSGSYCASSWPSCSLRQMPCQHEPSFVTDDYDRVRGILR
jgi:hypothetical protein